MTGAGVLKNDQEAGRTRDTEAATSWGPRHRRVPISHVFLGRRRSLRTILASPTSRTLVAAAMGGEGSVRFRAPKHIWRVPRSTAPRGPHTALPRAGSRMPASKRQPLYNCNQIAGCRNVSAIRKLQGLSQSTLHARDRWVFREGEDATANRLLGATALGLRCLGWLIASLMDLLFMATLLTRLSPLGEKRKISERGDGTKGCSNVTRSRCCE